MDLRLHSSLTQVLLVEDSSQVGYARRTAQKLAEQLGFDATDAGRVALVVTELASNILKHASSGEVHLRTLPGAVSGVEVIAIDRGQGFDLHDCMPDGVSTRGTQGIGLGSILRQAQVFDVHSDQRGTVLLTRFYPRAAVVRDLRAGVSQHSLHDDPACGDAWELAIKGQQISMLMIDGLGHGPEAEAAARAGATAFNREPFAEPGMLLEEIHHDMRGTRGGALAIAQGERGRPLHMPRPSAMGIVLAFFAFVAGFALVWHIFWLALGALAGIGVACLARGWRTDLEEEVAPEAITAFEARGAAA